MIRPFLRNNLSFSVFNAYYKTTITRNFSELNNKSIVNYLKKPFSSSSIIDDNLIERYFEAHDKTGLLITL